MQVRCGFAVVALLAALLLTPLFAQQQAQSKVSGVFPI